MSKITGSTDFNRVPEDKFKRVVVEWAQNVTQVVNGQLEFGVNIKGALNEVTFSGAPIVLQTQLGRPPNGFLVFSTSAPMSIYETARSLDSITVSSSAPGSALVFVF